MRRSLSLSLSKRGRGQRTLSVERERERERATDAEQDAKQDAQNRTQVELVSRERHLPHAIRGDAGPRAQPRRSRILARKSQDLTRATCIRARVASPGSLLRYASSPIWTIESSNNEAQVYVGFPQHAKIVQSLKTRLRHTLNNNKNEF